jgi:GntR family transcriptional repressor for pyruvate dehydrogenase complex
MERGFVMKHRRGVQRRRIHEDIVEYLLNDINDGIYKIGEDLPSERDLMDEFQVGWPAIRESLLKLERMGVIETKPGVRAKIRKPSVSPLLEEMGNVVKLNLRTTEGQRIFQEARCFLESALARFAARWIDDERLAKLKTILDAEENLLNDLAAFADTDLEFHKIIAEVYENPIFKIVYHNMSKWLLEQRLATLGIPGQPAMALQAHVSIYEALLAHDPDKAETAMTEHLCQITRIYQSAKPPSDASP